MKIAVVILNWNGAGLLQQFLPSVVAFSPEADIYLADNDSSDDSVQIVKSKFPTVKIIQNDANYGFAKGYNEALKHLDADIFALVNSDVEVTENWLKPIIETFQNEPGTAIVQPKILDFKRKDHFEYAGAAGGFIDKYGYPFCRGRIFDTIEKDDGQYDDDTNIFWASGACLFIRSSVFHELNGFDEDFFAHQEEIDLCWRAFNKGLHAKYVSGSTVYHVGGATLEQGNPQKTYLNFRNSMFMLTKNLPKKQLFSRLFVRMILDGIAAVQFLVKGKPKLFLAILKAHGSFYSGFSKNYRKRAGVQNQNYFKVTTLVFENYIKGKKTYRQLF